jgi:hypothetical protein
MAHGQIQVQNEDAKWQEPIAVETFPNIFPRITIEYGNEISDFELQQPPVFSRIPRIILEYATTIFKSTLVTVPVCKGNLDGDVDVDDSDLAAFAADFGRTDCSGDCGSDFDHDEDADGYDLTIIIDNFGRTDCPFFDVIP